MERVPKTVVFSADAPAWTVRPALRRTRVLTAACPLLNEAAILFDETTVPEKTMSSKEEKVVSSSMVKLLMFAPEARVTFLAREFCPARIPPPEETNTFSARP